MRTVLPWGCFFLLGSACSSPEDATLFRYTVVNYDIIRFVDVLLIVAEAEVELNNLDRALELVNMVRSRAQNSPVKNPDGTDAANYVIDTYPAFSSQEQARQAVRFERKLELSGGGHRFYDLVHWGLQIRYWMPI